MGLQSETDWGSLLRAAAEPSRLSSERLRGKRVLITGAGGSIGSALVHTALASAAQSLVLLDTSEDGLYRVDRGLREAGSRVHRPVMGSVGDAGLLARLFAGERPEIVFHAGALKHVPLMELNPFAAVETNALGTFRLATEAAVHGVKRVVLVSTDKAVEPRSVMGASKRLAELALSALGASGPTKMTAVRLGNVLGSQGSVLPLFEQQIARGGPVTVTHPEVARFFMTMDAAVGALLAGLEVEASPAVLAPDPGPLLRVVDLARYVIAAKGNGAEVAFTGLRPGDKLAESMLSADERWVEPPVRGLRQILTGSRSAEIVAAAMAGLEDAVRRSDLGALLKEIAVLVPEYQPSSVIQQALVTECEAVR